MFSLALKVLSSTVFLDQLPTQVGFKVTFYSNPPNSFFFLVGLY
jgi:hypothetical protein